MVLNQMVLVGRIASDIKLIKEDDGKKKANFTIAVPRNYKNVDGVYETDLIPISTCGEIAKNTIEYCKQGDMIAIKGCLKCNSYETDDDYNRIKLEVVANQLTFLAHQQFKDKKNNDKER